ncbi:MAG TPA: Gfo/Idh/MocA family oxidoreductase, partial [Caldilineaceae bacterium]|nr:Gfo/Idh/MocA family oxidoreductase [Caldilineaceae bacterium]
MTKSHKVTMLGTGLIGLFYTLALHGQRNRDRVEVIYSRSQGRASKFAGDLGITHAVTDMKQAIEHPETDTVVIGLPNHLHEEAVAL